MDRRRFLTLSGTGLLGLAFGDKWSTAEAKASRKGEYSVVILGDTHFDTEPASVYHSNYNEPVEWLNRVQRAEFARNGEMWRERCPRLLRRASRLIGKDTKMVLQVGDLIQGDCGNGEVHKKMLTDVMDSFKATLSGLPFVTVVGNHDVRGVDAEKTYYEFMPQRMSQELGQTVAKTTFAFYIGPDAYIVIDFNKPDDDEVERLLKQTEGARYTFVLIHGALFPMDLPDCRWIYHGGGGEEETQKRRHFRRLFAQRNVICLCGHTHTTEFYDWVGDGGRITQITMNSVWKDEATGIFTIDAESPSMYGELRKGSIKDDGSKAADEDALFAEYRPGLRQWLCSPAAGSYKMIVNKDGVAIDFYVGDSETVTRRFVVR